MKKIYNKNAREKQLLEEAYGAIYERRNPDADEWGGGLRGVLPGAEEGPDFGNEEEEHDEYHPGYGKVEEVDHLAEAIKDMMKTFLNSDEFEGGLQDAFDITIEQIGDSLGYYNLENIGFTEDEEREDNEDIDLTVDAGMSPQDRREAGEY